MEKQLLNISNVNNLKNEKKDERNKKINCLKEILQEIKQKNIRINLINEKLEKYKGNNEDQAEKYKELLLTDLSEKEDLIISLIFEAVSSLNNVRKEMDEVK